MYVLAVEGMKENGREADVIRSIKAIDGSAEVSVDLLNETVKVQSVKSPEIVKLALENKGFKVSGSN
jgi:copper chaperone